MTFMDSAVGCRSSQLCCRPSLEVLPVVMYSDLAAHTRRVVENDPRCGGRVGHAPIAGRRPKVAVIAALGVFWEDPGSVALLVLSGWLGLTAHPNRDGNE